MKIKDVDVLYFYCLKWLILPIQKKAKGFQNFKVYGQIHSKGEPLPTSITNHQAQTSMEHNNVQSSVQTNLFTHTTHLSNFLLQPITYSMSQNQKSLQLINIFLQSSIELMWLPIMTLAISIVHNFNCFFKVNKHHFAKHRPQWLIVQVDCILRR